MADINNLNIDPNVPTPDWGQYDLGGSGAKPLPPEGTYLFKSKAFNNAEDLTAGKERQLIIRIDPTIVTGPHAGYEMKYTRVSTKKYSNREASQAGDYLKAAGYRGTPQSPQDYANAAEACAGTTFEAEVQWRAWDKEASREACKGMDNFPMVPIDPANPSAGQRRQSWVPAEGTGPGQPLPLRKVYANLEIARFRVRR